MRRITMILAALPFCLAACGDGTGTGATGALSVLVTSPHGDDGALAITLQGQGLTALTPAGSTYRVYWRLASDGNMQVLIFGTITSGPLFTVEVGDVRHPDRYVGTVTQAATRADALRDDVSRYTVQFARVAAP